MAPHRPEAEVVSASLLAAVDGAKAGGDFRLIEDVGARTIAVVGDVTGNGEAAAPFADELCAECQRAIHQQHDPADLLEHLNAYIYADPRFDRFTTACAVMIDREQWEARWGFAGHLPPHWLDIGLPIDGATPGLPLGVEPRCGAVSAGRKPLRPGEGMLLFTDGLEDVRGPAGDRFGSARVTHVLASSLHGAEPATIVRTMKAAACEFGDQELPDDLCLLALRVMSPAPVPLPPLG